MRSRRLACFLLAIWLTGGVFMAWIATENFRSVDRLLERPNPVAALEFHALGRDSTRVLLRYQVSEQNRYYFETWETAQILLGLLFFFFLLLGTREGKFSLLAALLMLGIVAGQRLLITPEMISTGRAIDFVPDNVRGSAGKRFRLLHEGYVAVELAKWGLGAALGISLIAGRRKGSGDDVREQLDLINKANYRHIDR